MNTFDKICKFIKKKHCFNLNLNNKGEVFSRISIGCLSHNILFAASFFIISFVLFCFFLFSFRYLCIYLYSRVQSSDLNISRRRTKRRQTTFHNLLLALSVYSLRFFELPSNCLFVWFILQDLDNRIYNYFSKP